jgi:hypothetical protein
MEEGLSCEQIYNQSKLSKAITCHKPKLAFIGKSGSYGLISPASLIF